MLMRLGRISGWVKLGFVAVAILALVSIYGPLIAGCSGVQVNAQRIPPPSSLAGDFTLSDQDGNIVTMQSLRGKAVVVDFIYTNCLDACPAITGKLLGLQHSLKAAGLGDRVVFLSITIDPERDTPEVLSTTTVVEN